MVIYRNDFKNCTNGKQPYSIVPEACHRYSNYDGFVQDNTFYLNRITAKQLLEMPDAEDFDLSIKLSYLPPAELAHFKKLAWGVFFGYDKELRCGNMLTIEYYHSENRVKLILSKVCGVKKQELERKSFNINTLLPGIKYDAKISYHKNRLSVSLFNIDTYFDCESESGIIALSREAGVGGIGFSDIEIDGAMPDTENVWSGEFSIPRTDGGVLDYKLTLSINRFLQKNKLYEIKYELSGGVCESDTGFRSADCWVGDCDNFDGLYFSFGGGRYYLTSDKLIFVDKKFQDLKTVLGGSDVPYKGSFTADSFDSFENIFIGYNNRFSENAGNLTSDRMFTYNKNGKLLFIGKALDKNCFFDVKSSSEKAITKRIPKDLPDYDAFLYNAQNNHYFLTNEAPEFYIDVYSKASEEFLEFEAELENAWFEKSQALEMVKTSSEDNIFASYGYNKYSFSVKCDTLGQGVYHIKLICRYGTDKLYEHTSAFEVLDDSKDEAPPETSGLPTIYCGDGIRSRYATFDFAHAKPDFNIMHYISWSLDGPITAEKRRVWEVLKLYHRKLIIWMTFRTLVSKDETYLDHLEATKHADYLNYIYPKIETSRNYFRYDLWENSTFDAAFVRATYKAFLSENKDIENVFPKLGDDGSVDMDKWGKIPGAAFDRWVTYINSKTLPLFKKQWEKIKKVNPNAKRFAYGPYHLYAINNSGGYTAKWFGFSKEGLSDVFGDGFLQFEDYPFVCGYQTHICAWNMATIKLENKDVRIAPELYDSFDPGCPDGHVANARPPLGESYAPPYQTITQIYEYLYNTAAFDNASFRYWEDNILQMYDHTSHEPEKRYKLLLKAWKIYLDNKPKKSLSPIAYITDYTPDDDRRTNEIANGALYNRSQTGLSIVHEVNAEMGYPQGFVLKFESLDKLSDASLIVLPSLKNADGNAIAKIRQLYADGASLIATSDITGLEDIFGVEPYSTKDKCTKITYGDKEEAIYPYTCEFFYRPTDAQTIVYAQRNPAILKKDRAMLLNVPLGELGVDSFMPTTNGGRANISKLVRDAIGDFIRANINPPVYADKNCGVVLTETVNNETLLILTDYSPDTNTEPTEVNIAFGKLDVKKIQNLVYEEHDINLNKFEANGLIKGISVKIRPHETLIFKIK